MSEEVLGKLEGRIEEMSKRLNDFHSDISELRNEIRVFRKEIEDRIDTRFYWTIGLLSLIFTIITFLAR